MVIPTSISTAVHTAKPAEAAACLATLTRAFEADPVCRWAWPETARYRDAFPRFCRAFGGSAFSAGTAHVAADNLGVALWLAPGAAPDDEGVADVIRETAPEQLQQPLFDMFAQMEAFHPRGAHWRLPLIGVDPSVHGRGVGSALLRHALKLCDETRVLAYLEATNAGCVRLYERHGFEPMGRIQADGSPVVTPMVRIPA